MKVSISLGALVVQTKTVTVEVPNDFGSWEDYRQRRLMHSVYDADDEGDGFEDDPDAGVEEGTHYLVTVLDDDDPTTPDFAATDEDNVVRYDKQTFAFTDEERAIIKDALLARYLQCSTAGDEERASKIEGLRKFLEGDKL